MIIHEDSQLESWLLELRIPSFKTFITGGPLLDIVQKYVSCVILYLMIYLSYINTKQQIIYFIFMQSISLTILH